MASAPHQPHDKIDALVGEPRKDLQTHLKKDFAIATEAWEIFHVVEVLNATLVCMAMGLADVTIEVARDMPISRIDEPVRNNSINRIVPYRSLKRTTYHFFESLSQVAVKANTFCVTAKTIMGSVAEKALQFSPDEASYLLEGD